MDAIEKLLASIEGNIEKLSSDAMTSIGSMAEEFLTSKMGNTENVPTATAGELGGDDEAISSMVLGGTNTPVSALDENVDGPVEMGSEVGADETTKSDGDTAAHTAEENSVLSKIYTLGVKSPLLGGFSKPDDLTERQVWYGFQWNSAGRYRYGVEPAKTPDNIEQ